jgi:hypothetical protein
VKNRRKSKSFHIHGKFQSVKADLLVLVWWLTVFCGEEKVEVHRLATLGTQILGINKNYVPSRMGFFCRLEGGKDPSGLPGCGYFKPSGAMEQNGRCEAVVKVELRKRAKDILVKRMTNEDRFSRLKRIIEAYNNIDPNNRDVKHLRGLVEKRIDTIVFTLTNKRKINRPNIAGQSASPQPYPYWQRVEEEKRLQRQVGTSIYVGDRESIE